MTEYWVYIGYYPGEDPEIFKSFDSAFIWLTEGYKRAEAINAEAFPYIFRVRPGEAGMPKMEGYILLEDDSWVWEEWDNLLS